MGGTVGGRLFSRGSAETRRGEKFTGEPKGAEDRQCRLTTPWWLICHSLLCASASQREILFSCHVGGAVANRSVEDIFPAEARRGGEEPERRFISDWAVERGDGSAGSTKHLIYLLSSASRRLSGNPVFAARRGRGRQSFGLKTFFPRRRGEAEKNRKGDLYRMGGGMRGWIRRQHQTPHLPSLLCVPASLRENPFSPPRRAR